MIRVNLLPIKQARRRSAGRTQLFVFALLLVVEVLAITAIYLTTNAELESRLTEVAQHDANVKAAKKEVEDAKTLEQEAERLAQQLKVLDDLEQNRSGPVRLLDELQGILSPPRNEEDRFAQLQKNWNVEWDTRRLWLEKLDDKDSKFAMEGYAGNADDVAEFLQRLGTARHFRDIQLDIVEAASMGGGQGQAAARTVKFKINGSINYGGDETPEG